MGSLLKGKSEATVCYLLFSTLSKSETHFGSQATYNGVLASFGHHADLTQDSRQLQRSIWEPVAAQFLPFGYSTFRSESSPTSQ